MKQIPSTGLTSRLQVWSEIEFNSGMATPTPAPQRTGLHTNIVDISEDDAQGLKIV